jgi:hypothetical protein
MDDLELLIKDIQTKNTIATSDPGSDPNSRRTRLGQISRAKEDVAEMTSQYREELSRRAAFILVTGKQADLYSQLASGDLFGCFSVNPESFYEDLVNKIPERLYLNQPSSPSLFDHLGVHFEDRALEIGVLGYPALLFEAKYKKTLKSKEDMLNLTKRAFNDKVGGEVVAVDAIARITDKAVALEFSSKVCPIVLATNDVELVKELEQGIKRTLTDRVFVVATGTKIDKSISSIAFDKIKTVDEKSVEENLLKIRKHLL